MPCSSPAQRASLAEFDHPSVLVVQPLVAVAGQLDAFLEDREGLVEGELTRLEAPHAGLELLHQLVEVTRLAHADLIRSIWTSLKVRRSPVSTFLATST